MFVEENENAVDVVVGQEIQLLRVFLFLQDVLTVFLRLHRVHFRIVADETDQVEKEIKDFGKSAEGVVFLRESCVDSCLIGTLPI